MRARTAMPHCLGWLSGLVACLLVAVTFGCAVAPVAPESPELTLHIQAAVADAARRTGLDAAALKVASAERVTWLDGSLGCPEPDMMYTQALVPGYRIRIDARGETLDYHVGEQGAPLLCPQARSVDPASERRSQRDAR